MAHAWIRSAPGQDFATRTSSRRKGSGGSVPSLAPLKAPKRPDFDSLVGLALAFWDRGRVYQSALLLHQANKLEGRRDVQFQEKLARAMLRVFHMTCSASSLRAGTEAYECALNAKDFIQDLWGQNVTR